MRSKTPLCCALILASMSLLLPAGARGQAVKVTRRSAVGVGSLSVVVAPSQVTFNLASRTVTAGSDPIVITTTYGGLPVSSNLSLYGYFASATAALTGRQSADAIPSSDVLGEMTTGLPRSFTSFTQSGPFGSGGASLRLFSQPVLGGNGSRTDQLNLQIDLTNLPQLPANTYTGALVLQVQAL